MHGEEQSRGVLCLEDQVQRKAGALTSKNAVRQVRGLHTGTGVSLGLAGGGEWSLFFPWEWDQL